MKFGAGQQVLGICGPLNGFKLSLCSLESHVLEGRFLSAIGLFFN